MRGKRGDRGGADLEPPSRERRQVYWYYLRKYNIYEYN